MLYNDVSAKIDAMSDKYLDFLEEICSIESNSTDKDAINRVVDYIIDFEKNNGYSFERVSFEKSGDCLLIDFIVSDDKPTIAFSAHMDTVHKKGDFGYPPVRRDGEFIYGPGVCDCKGGVAVGLLAMNALKQAGFDKANIRFLFQSDEEVSSRLSNKKTIEYICEKAKGSIAFLNLEPMVLGTLATERGGIINAKFTVTGKSIHSKDKELGINAINEAVYKISEVLSSELNSIASFNCGLIEGGRASNVVPDKCSFNIEARITKMADYDKILKYFDELSKKSYVEGSKTELEIVSDRIPMELKDFNVDLFNKINEISIKYGFGELKMRQTLGGSDAAYTTEAGIPTVDGIGITGYNLHALDEKAEIKSLAERAKLLAAVVIELSC